MNALVSLDCLFVCVSVSLSVYGTRLPAALRLCFGFVSIQLNSAQLQWHNSRRFAAAVFCVFC